MEDGEDEAARGAGEGDGVAARGAGEAARGAGEEAVVEGRRAGARIASGSQVARSTGRGARGTNSRCGGARRCSCRQKLVRRSNRREHSIRFIQKLKGRRCGGAITLSERKGSLIKDDVP